MNYQIKNLYSRLTPQQIIKMDAFTKAEITCQRMLIKFSDQFTKNKKDVKIRLTPATTVYDADMTFFDLNNQKHKCHCEFKTRTKLYDSVYIEPKNVKFAIDNNDQYEYLYFNFFDDLKTHQRHLYVWSSYTINFNNLASETKGISKTEVTDSQLQYQKRYLLPLKDATEHYIIPISELWTECMTEEYLNLWRNSL